MQGVSGDFRRGSSLVMLLVTLLIIAGLCAGVGSRLGPRGGAAVGPDGGGSAASPLDASVRAVCQTNRLQIQQALQLYSFNHPPMQKLDLQALGVRIQASPNVVCSYSLDAGGRVVCSQHP